MSSAKNALFLLLISYGCSFLSAETLTIGGFNFPPYMIQEGYDLGDGKIGYGVDADILKAIVEKAGYKTEYRWAPFKRVKVELMETGFIDLSAAFFLETEYPENRQILYDLGGATVLYKNATVDMSIRNVSDLSGLSIGLVRGDSYGDEFDALIKENIFYVEEVAVDEQNFKMLEASRIDLLAINNAVGEFYVKDLGFEKVVEPVTLKFDYENTLTGGIYIVASQQLDFRIVEKIRQAAKEFVLERGVEEIKSFYGVTDYPFTIEYYRNH